ncbi:hypothetical protein F5Y06DRAFT_103714 [Hypoxylon sp. FL0890]|nr:hypothetical protein F5Y06DRAFT_103714 [Hypoxylon sp. FL0890]
MCMGIRLLACLVTTWAHAVIKFRSRFFQLGLLYSRVPTRSDRLHPEISMAETWALWHIMCYIYGLCTWRCMLFPFMPRWLSAALEGVYPFKRTWQGAMMVPLRSYIMKSIRHGNLDGTLIYTSSILGYPYWPLRRSSPD